MLAIIQARMKSSRLPGKVLAPILGKPMLARQIERTLGASEIDRLVVATSTDAADDPIEAVCNGMQIGCFRGHPTDILDRFYRAAQWCSAPHVVRLTADCPLCDPGVIDQVVRFYAGGDFDYASNVVERTYPDGLDVEVLRFTALEQAWRDAVTKEHREHMPFYIRSRPDRFKVGSFRGPLNIFHHRWTVDETEDFEFVRVVYESLYPTNPKFTWIDILDLMERRPDIIKINGHCGAEVTRTDPRRIAS